jgi:hypothetical protein
MDPSETACHSMAAVEASQLSSSRTDSPRPGPRESVGPCDEWPRSLVECWRQPHESGGPDSFSEPTWPRKTCPKSPRDELLNRNRRIRNRTYGGVGGRRGATPRRLPDIVALRDLRFRPPQCLLSILILAGTGAFPSRDISEMRWEGKAATWPQTIYPGIARSRTPGITCSVTAGVSDDVPTITVPVLAWTS